MAQSTLSPELGFAAPSSFLPWLRRCESAGGGARSCDGGENDAGAVEHAWFRWCAMAAEAAAMVVREEEELAVAVNLKVDSRLVQVRWNATVTGGFA